MGVYRHGVGCLRVVAPVSLKKVQLSLPVAQGDCTGIICAAPSLGQSFSMNTDILSGPISSNAHACGIALMFAYCIAASNLPRWSFDILLRGRLRAARKVMHDPAGCMMMLKACRAKLK